MLGKKKNPTKKPTWGRREEGVYSRGGGGALRFTQRSKQYIGQGGLLGIVVRFDFNSIQLRTPGHVSGLGVSQTSVVFCLPVVRCVEFHSHHCMKSDSKYRTSRTSAGGQPYNGRNGTVIEFKLLAYEVWRARGQETPPFEELSWTDSGVPWDAVQGRWSQRQQ